MLIACDDEAFQSSNKTMTWFPICPQTLVVKCLLLVPTLRLSLLLSSITHSATKRRKKHLRGQSADTVTTAVLVFEETQSMRE